MCITYPDGEGDLGSDGVSLFVSEPYPDDFWSAVGEVPSMVSGDKSCVCGVDGVEASDNSESSEDFLVEK